MESRHPDESSGRPGREHRSSEGSVGMRMRAPSLWLLPLGAGSRLAGAALIVAALWAGFFWAVSTSGGP